MRSSRRGFSLLRTAGLSTTIAGVGLLSLGTMGASATTVDPDWTHSYNSLTTVASGLTGYTLSDSATLKTYDRDPDGSVTFALYSGAGTNERGSCIPSGALVGAKDSDASLVHVAGSHQWTASSDPVSLATPALSPGEHDFHWVVSWGSSEHKVTAACENVTVFQPTITTKSGGGAPIGGSVSDTAVLSNASNDEAHSSDPSEVNEHTEDELAPTGKVTFSLYAPDRREGDDGRCGDVASASSSSAIVAGKDADDAYTAASGPLATAALGTYNWIASYGGDANNLPVASRCGEPTRTVRAQPVLSTTPSSAVATVGSAISDTATLTGAFSPTGVVSFSLYGPTDLTCTGTPLFTDADVAALSTTSHTFTTASVGVYHWSVSYAGDRNNLVPAASVCTETVTVSAVVIVPTSVVANTTTTPTVVAAPATGVSAASAVKTPSTGAALPLGLAGALLVSGLGILGLGARRRRTNG